MNIIRCHFKWDDDLAWVKCGESMEVESELQKTGNINETCAICSLSLSIAWAMTALSRGWSWSSVCLFRLVVTPQLSRRSPRVALNNILTLNSQHKTSYSHQSEQSLRHHFHSWCNCVTVWASMTECRPYGVLDHPDSSVKHFTLANDVNDVVAFTALHLCNAVFPMSVCPSVCPSVKRVNCDKTKAPSAKSSIMTNSYES